MKIISLNVNGIRASAKKGLFCWLDKEDADIICLQEVRAQKNQLNECFYPEKYHCYYNFALKPGYSGTAVFSKNKPDKVKLKTNWQLMDDEGRFSEIRFGNLSIISLYLMSGSSSQVRQDIKMNFLQGEFKKFLEKIKDDKRSYIICGDYNIAHKKIDIKNWRANQNKSGFLPEERAYLDFVFEK